MPLCKVPNLNTQRTRSVIDLNGIVGHFHPCASVGTLHIETAGKRGYTVIDCQTRSCNVAILSNLEVFAIIEVTHPQPVRTEVVAKGAGGRPVVASERPTVDDTPHRQLIERGGTGLVNLPAVRSVVVGRFERISNLGGSDGGICDQAACDRRVGKLHSQSCHL